MEWFSILGNLASLIGLVVATWTLLRVGTITTALKQQSRGRHLTGLIDTINRTPEAKTILTESSAIQVD